MPAQDITKFATNDQGTYKVETIWGDRPYFVQYMDYEMLKNFVFKTPTFNNDYRVTEAVATL